MSSNNKKVDGKKVDHYNITHDELMSGSFWMVPGQISEDFYSALMVI